MCCCFLPSCCCGWQTLEHGLFIFALLDILFNLFMVGMNVAAYSTVFAGLNVALFVADICLAVGAKQAVGFLLLLAYILPKLISTFLHDKVQYSVIQNKVG